MQYTEETARLINSWIHSSPLPDMTFKGDHGHAGSAFLETIKKIKVKRPFRTLKKRIKFMERKRTDRVAHRG